MLNNTNIFNPTLLTNVFAAKMTLDKLTIVLHVFLLLKSVGPSSPDFYCTDVIYFFFSLRFIHYTFRCESAFTCIINRTYCIKNKQSSPAHIYKVTQK